MNDERAPNITLDKNELQCAVVLRLFVTVKATNWNITKSNIIEAIKSKFDQNLIISLVPTFARDQATRIKKDLEESTRK